MQLPLLSGMVKFVKRNSLYIVGSTSVLIGPVHPSRIRTNTLCSCGRGCMRICGWTFYLFFVFDSGWNRPCIGPFKKKKHWNALEEEEQKRKRKIRTRWEQKPETHLKSKATTFPRYRGSRETKKRKRKRRIRIQRMTDWVCEKEWVGGKKWMWFSGWVVHVGGFGKLGKVNYKKFPCC